MPYSSQNSMQPTNHGLTSSFAQLCANVLQILRAVSPLNFATASLTSSTEGAVSLICGSAFSSLELCTWRMHHEQLLYVLSICPSAYEVRYEVIICCLDRFEDPLQGLINPGALENPSVIINKDMVDLLWYFYTKFSFKYSIALSHHEPGIPTFWILYDVKEKDLLSFLVPEQWEPIHNSPALSHNLLAFSVPLTVLKSTKTISASQQVVQTAQLVQYKVRFYYYYYYA